MRDSKSIAEGGASPAPQPEAGWDLEAIYDEKISPLMVQIIAIAKEHRLPMFASFAYRDDGAVTSFCTTHLHYDGRRPERLALANSEVRRSGYSSAMVVTIGPAPQAPPEELP